MSPRRSKRRSSLARQRAEYVARRDAAPNRSVYRRLPPETHTDRPHDGEEGSDLPIWPSARKVTVTSQYQRPHPGFPQVLRTGLGRLVAILVIVCPLVVLAWSAFEYFHL